MRYEIMPKGIDLFDSTADVLVCPVNLMGLMGAGISRAFVDRYGLSCGNWNENRHKVQLGDVYMDSCRHEKDGRSIWICFMPVHASPAEPASIEAIRSAILELFQTVTKMGLRSVAMPAVGCGIGKLDWDSQVLPTVIGLCKQDNYRREELNRVSTNPPMFPAEKIPLVELYPPLSDLGVGA